MKVTYTTPGGSYYRLFDDMLNQTHLLIAGATGSGKSVVINRMIYTALVKYTPVRCQFILIDPKRVELVAFKKLPHTIAYASEPGEMVEALDRAMMITEQRYREMQRKELKKYEGAAVYVIIDELADLMTTNRKEVQPLLQRLCQIGRAANVHVVAATQCPLSSVIPTPIKVNFDSRVGLRTRSAQDSRNILGVKGCETLPRFGEGFYMTAEAIQHTTIPMNDERQLQELIEYWQPKKKGLFEWLRKAI